MASAHEKISISLPRDLVRLVDHRGKADLRNRSEVIRDALRMYLTRRPPREEPTEEELRADARGREEISRGEYVTLADLLNELDRPRRKARPKNAPARTPR